MSAQFHCVYILQSHANPENFYVGRTHHLRDRCTAIPLGSSRARPGIVLTARRRAAETLCHHRFISIASAQSGGEDFPC
jgi:hypothetical protein